MQGPLLEELPKRPSAQEFHRWVPVVHEIVNTCDGILRALTEEGVLRVVEPILDALQDGVPVANEVRQPAIDFSNGLTIMFFKLRPMAVAWLTRLDERIELDRDMEQRVKAWTEEHGRVSN